MQTAVLCLIPLTVLFHAAEGSVGPTDPPLQMGHCFYRYKQKTGLTQTPGGSITYACDNMYMWMNANELNSNRGANPSSRAYMNFHSKGIKNDMKQHKIRRHKRQAGQPHPQGPKQKPRLRKEVRMMSNKEWNLYIDAVNSAKKNTSISPNKYDAIAEMHTGITAISAHGGCGFHPWHRIYLHIFEQALREEGPQFADVTVPYWDSRLDNYMEDPTTSALFSERLMGTGQGEAKGGIMRDGWDSSVGRITRNLGTDGPLFNDMMVHNVTKHHRMREICGEDSAIDHDCEFHHNGAHRFGDGQFAVLASSVFDPIFWIHHCFVDKIWEDFRENQKKHGIDSETDYPANPTTMGSHELQLPGAETGFDKLTIQDGMSNLFTEEYFHYAPSPVCRNPKLGCGSKFLKCVKNEDTSVNKGPWRCVARTLREVEEWEAEQTTPTFEPCVLGEANYTKPKYKAPKETNPVQNTFCMNGKSDTKQWVYMPVKLIIRRPPDFKRYNSYPVSRGKINKIGGDIYSPTAYTNIKRYLKKRPEQPKAYDQCLESDSLTNTIYIKSVGLNYEGVYKEFAILDKRLALTVATAYVAVRRPLSPVDASVSILHAQDSCGRVCKPICKVPGVDIFRPCSGAVKVSGGSPLQYGNSFGDAVLQVFDFTKDKGCPQVSAETIIMSFYCDYSTEWIWPSIAPPPTPKNEPRPDIKPGCKIGYGCTVSKPCRELSTCVEGAFLDCNNMCHIYARCKVQRYMIYQCRRNEKYLSGHGCIAVPKDKRCKNPNRRGRRSSWRSARSLRSHQLPYFD